MIYHISIIFEIIHLSIIYFFLSQFTMKTIRSYLLFSVKMIDIFAILNFNQLDLRKAFNKKL